jgi:hypothetical protein
MKVLCCADLRRVGLAFHQTPDDKVDVVSSFPLSAHDYAMLTSALGPLIL